MEKRTEEKREDMCEVEGKGKRGERRKEREERGGGERRERKRRRGEEEKREEEKRRRGEEERRATGYADLRCCGREGSYLVLPQQPA